MFFMEICRGLIREYLDALPAKPHRHVAKRYADVVQAEHTNGIKYVSKGER